MIAPHLRPPPRDSGPSEKRRAMEQITGFVTKAGGSKTFFVAEAICEGPNGPAAIKVTAPGVRFQVGDYFVADGHRGKEDPKYSRGKAPRDVFKAKSMRPELPQDADAVTRWFGRIFTQAEHGVTPASIAAFVAKHGAGAALLCQRTPELIVGLSASPQRHRAAIAQDWGRRISGRRAVTLLETCGIEANVIAAIIAVLRDEAYEAIQRNPYQVSAIKDVGFRNADRVGSHMGVKPEDANRISAAMDEALGTFSSEGHTYASASDLGRVLNDTYDIPVSMVGPYILKQASVPTAPFVIESTPAGFIAQPRRLSEAEAVVADGIVRMLAHGRRNPAEEVDAVIAELCASIPAFAKFDPIQRMGVALCSREPFSVLTGGPGTGKSAVSKLAVKVAERFGDDPILLCAPTGKAAKRLEETTGRAAVTLHKLLGAIEDKSNDTTTFQRNRKSPLPAGCLVLVDEASMIDATTMRALVEAMPPDGRLMLVGDRNQLPSVDPGAILRDVLATKVGGHPLVPQTELVNIYRQGAESRIATGSVLVRNGELPVLTNDFGSGLALSEVGTDRICDNIEWLVRRALDSKPAFEPRDIMVLAPQRKGTAGTYELNRRLSSLVNPKGARIEGIVRTQTDEREGVPLPRVGDRVMQTENDSENDVMNGDIGEIAAAFSEKDGAGVTRHKIRVLYDSGKEVVYPVTKWRTLQLAYAITIHKSQGSQYPLVIMPVTATHQGLDRALIYTGWTRAERYLFLVGEREALEAGVGRIDSSLRQTKLPQLCVDAARRIGFVPPPPPVALAMPDEPARPSRRVPLPSPRRIASAQPLSPDARVAAPPPEPPVVVAAEAVAPPSPPPAPSGLPRPRAVPSQRPLPAAKPAAPAGGPVPRMLAGQVPRAPEPVPEPVRVPDPVSVRAPEPVPVPVSDGGPVRPRTPRPRIAPQPTPPRPAAPPPAGHSAGPDAPSAPRPRLLTRPVPRVVGQPRRLEEAEAEPAPGPRP
jgi:exodeoxyribonuclease V alpha subunit